MPRRRFVTRPVQAYTLLVTAFSRHPNYGGLVEHVIGESSSLYWANLGTRYKKVLVFVLGDRGTRCERLLVFVSVPKGLMWSYIT
jgi:hypothetical protein